MKPKFQNQVILITGSSQGIGKSLAISLGKMGAIIGLNGRNQDKLEKTHKELTDLGIESLMVPGDVTDYQVCAGIVEKLINKYGRINCVVANGSVMAESYFMDTKPEVIKTVIESQVFGAVYPVKAALPAIIESKGYILFISSLSALYGLPRFSAYSMGKATHTNLSQSLRFELSNTGVDIGIAYVCFTKNEKHKQIFLADGNLGEIPKRPGRMQYSREKVALSLSKMILKRNKRKSLSFYGKAYDLCIRFAPIIVKRFIKRRLPI